MSDEPGEQRGDIVVYLDVSDPDNAAFRRAIVAGVGVTDPETDTIWVPVARQDSELTLIDLASIVPALDAAPEAEPLGADQPPAALHVLAMALAALARAMTELDETAPMAVPTARDLLARFVDALAPVDDALRALVAADPRGGLATVLSCLSSAADEFGQGRVEYGRAGILLANRAMVELLPPGGDEP